MVNHSERSHAATVAACLLLLTAGLIGALPGCKGKQDSTQTRGEGGGSDRERLLLIYYVPLGLSYEDVRQRLPALGELNAEEEGLRTAVMPWTVFDQEILLEMTFDHDTLVRCSYRLVSRDSTSGFVLYKRLQGFYTMEFGNYHEERDESGGSYFTQSSWSSTSGALVMTFRRERDGFLLVGRFEELPEHEVTPPEANAPGPGRNGRYFIQSSSLQET